MPGWGPRLLSHTLVLGAHTSSKLAVGCGAGRTLDYILEIRAYVMLQW